MKRLVRSVLILSAILGAGPLAAEVVEEKASGFVSRHEALVTASPKDVWLALISPAGWWNSDQTWSGEAANLSLMPQAGGCFCETIPEVDGPGGFTLQGSVEHMRVIQAYPETALRMQGALGPLQSEPVIGILTIAIRKSEGGTRIVWEYNVGGTMRYEVPVISKVVDGVMGAQLSALAKQLGPVVEVRPAPPALQAAPGEGAGVASTKPGQAPGTGSPAAGNMSGPVVAPAAKPPTNAPAVKPAAQAAPKPAPQAAAQPSAKPASVEDAFADLESVPKF